MHEKAFNLCIFEMTDTSYLQLKSYQVFVQLILEQHLGKKTNKQKTITDLKECKCRRRAEHKSDPKQMSLQAV